MSSEDGEEIGCAGPGGPAGCGEITSEEKAAIESCLNGSGARGGKAGRLQWLAKRGLKLIAMALVAGVGIAVGDGNEFDGVDCGVAAKPSGREAGKAASGESKSQNRNPPSPGFGATSPPEPGDAAAGPRSPSCYGVSSAGCGVARAGGDNEEVVKMLAGIREEIAAVRSEFVELRRENEGLRELHREGFFKFALRVDGEAFRDFAAIMALGHRKAAAKFLDVAQRSFYDRVASNASSTIARSWRMRVEPVLVRVIASMGDCQVRLLTSGSDAAM